MYKSCYYCGKTFKTSRSRLYYCSSKCSKDGNLLSRRIKSKENRDDYKKKDYVIKSRERTLAIKRASTKLASNSGKPYSIEDKALVMARKKDGSYKYSSTELALKLHRSISSINQTRKRENAKKEKNKII